MATSKRDLIYAMYNRALFGIVSGEGEWTRFLRSACRNYKCRFDEQVLIHAQRPDATAVLEIERWNSVYGRWVNRGAHGIAVFDQTSVKYPRLKHYFDVSDTHESKRARPVNIWEMKPEYEEAVIETLENSFGELYDKRSFGDAIVSAAGNAVSDNIYDYFIDMERHSSDGNLSMLSEDDREMALTNLVANSVAYMTLARLGVKRATSFLPDGAFDGLAYFDTEEMAGYIGTATSDIGEMVLREVASTILACEKEIRTFANADTRVDNEAETEAIAEEERSESDGSDSSDIHADGGLSISRPDRGTKTDSPWEIRADEGGLSTEAQQGTVLSPDDTRETSGASVGNRESGERTDGESGEGDRGEEQRDREPESERPDEVGRLDEQREADGGRKHPGGADIQLRPPKTTITQLSLFGEPEAEAPGFLIDGEDAENPTDIALPESSLAVNAEGLVGQEVSDGGRRFRIESVSEISGDVRMADITFTDGSGFPIDRIEKTAVVRQMLFKQQRREETETPAQAKKEPKVEGLNFHITDDNLGHGGAKTKYAANVAAIRTLNTIEAEGRMATPEEQETLSRYVGWGSLPQVFDEAIDAWKSEYAELKGLLSPEDYASARATTLNAHYTSPVVIKAIYKAIENMGFERGNILEPSCGNGNFMGLLPDKMAGSKVYGVELDSMTGRIAKQLYQRNEIQIKGFEETDFPDSFFDLAVGNVPFGSYGVADRKYDKHHFLIHDYFFAKTLDKVRPGGVVAFITSKGTLDKQNPAVRKYIAERADLLGAIRLPNNAFLANAGTGVTADIIFLQKRDRVASTEPEWINLGETENGVPVNRYFAKNPEMMLGEMVLDDAMYGNDKDTALKPFEGADLSEQLAEAVANIHAEFTEYEVDDELSSEIESIPADPDVRNFSYTLEQGKVYYRKDSRMYPQELSATAANRVKGMIAIRDAARSLIEYQTDDYPDETIERTQRELNAVYDRYTAKYGLLSSRGNSMAFSDDSSYPLLCSLEILDEDGKLLRKADMFTKRTIRPSISVTSVDTASEALAVSIAERAGVDIDFMSELCGKTPLELLYELRGVIFYNNMGGSASVFYTADEFLSGNVRQKLKDCEARLLSEEISAKGATSDKEREEYENSIENIKFNIAALQKVIPGDLGASEIAVRLGATWIPESVVNDFIYELLETPYNLKRNNSIAAHYSPHTATWNVEGKSYDRGNVKAFSTFGTARINAYKIIEETLNLRDVRVFDNIYEDGQEKRVLNKKETTVARGKQESIKAAFAEWVWQDHERREHLVRIYNDTFNAIRDREYNGEHIRFSGINPEIELYPHQKNAIARILYGGNTLLAHVVGAGKTFEMTAAAMESKRLGLCNKSLFVVPNHLTEQWAGEFLQLYPSASILVATRKDFETKNRREFCSRISTGDYDAVIIGHSQFEKIPMSIERQREMLERQIDDITMGIAETKKQNGERYTIKQMEKSRKSLIVKLQKLNDQSRKDDVVTFEQLGVDRLFIDEAHYYKNLYLVTKMRNVGGIAQTEAQKSSDLFMKCQYLDEITNSRGTVFATGTPISNSMVEMYTMQRYLQYEMLASRGLHHFDAWASTFGETISAIELAPEGTGYRMKTRFAKFYNLPELMSMFRMVADIQTADMLNLPVPEANYHNVALPPSEAQKEMVAGLSERADLVRKKMVEPHIDNMLLITNDGRKLALDERLMNSLLPANKNGKAAICADNIYRIWEETKGKRLTQLCFCDISTPKGDGQFNVYDDIRERLERRGIPKNEVAYIHEANTETQKKDLFAKLRSGKVRVLLGSTAKMGAGTNVQDRLYALHNIDCPWRPSDLEQRSGRILRQGNGNESVHIYRYVTEQTFDAYLYQIIENKQKFISQVMTSKSPVRSADDIDEQSLSYAEIKALATGNPHIKEKMDLDVEVARLKVLRASFLEQKYYLEGCLIKTYPAQIEKLKERINGYEADIAHRDGNSPKDKDDFVMELDGKAYTDKGEAGGELIAICGRTTSLTPVLIGSYRGFQMALYFEAVTKDFILNLKGSLSHSVTLGNDVHGNITRIGNVLDGLEKRLSDVRSQLESLEQQAGNAEAEVKKEFPQENELRQKSERLAELDAMLDMDERDMTATELDEDLPETQEKEQRDYER